jgi:hypothetical protein
LIKAGIQHRRVGEKNEGIQGGSNPSLWDTGYLDFQNPNKIVLL